MKKKLGIKDEELREEYSIVFHSTTYHGVIETKLTEEDNWWNLIMIMNDGSTQNMTIYKCDSERKDKKKKENKEE